MDERELERVEKLASYEGPHGLPTGELLKQISNDAKSLAKMEVNLAKVEAKMDLDAELDLAKGAVVGAVCAILGLNMLIVAAVFALAPKLAWVAALVVGIVLLIIAGGAAYIGWSRAEKNPLSNTRTTLLEDVEWARQIIK